MTRRTTLDTAWSEQPGDETPTTAEPMPWWATRRNRGRLRSFLRAESKLQRVRACGTVSRRAEGVGIAINMSAPAGERIAGLRGLVSCGSVWLCPRCAAVIGLARAGELKRGIQEWQSRGYAVLFLTLTVGHGREDSLRKVWDGIAPAWSALNRHRAWKTIKEEAGIRGFVRAVEATWSPKNGWHVHAHILLFVENAQEALNHTNDIKRLWISIAEKEGYEADPRWQDLRPVNPEDPERMARYVTKASNGKQWSAADEVMRWSTKRARGESRAPFEMLMDASYGDYEALQAWWEWEDGSHDRRQMTWSRNLRKELGLTTEAPDEELVTTSTPISEDLQAQDILDALDQGSPEIAGIPNGLWRQLTLLPEEMSEFLEAVEAGTAENVASRLRLLAAHYDWPLLVGPEWAAHRERFTGLQSASTKK